MAYLINRTPVARIRCLHALIKLIRYCYGKKVFHMGHLLYDRNKVNIHQFCDLIKKDSSLDIKYCPFLNNPLSEAGCYLTRGVKEDTTKRKEISNSVNSLDGLGIINRIGRELQLTSFGNEFAITKFVSYKWLILLRKALLKYGPMVGLLYQIYTTRKKIFNVSYLKVGYPDAGEFIIKNGKTIKISSGSKRDSNTRTKSTLLAWAVTAGFIAPTSFDTKVKERTSQIDANEYILRPIRNEAFYVKKYFPDQIFIGDFETERPLDYVNLSKNIGALREHGQEMSRTETLKLKDIILNRRFAITYLLNKAFTKKCNLDFLKTVSFLKKESSLFIINKDNFDNVMKIESFIAYMAGIPFARLDNNILRPLTGVNEKILCLNAPKKVVSYLEGIQDKVLVKI